MGDVYGCVCPVEVYLEDDGRLEPALPAVSAGAPAVALP